MRVSGIDSARALAAAMVLVCHAAAYWLVSGSESGLPWPLPEILASGAHGVDLFVVLSGFCLALPFASGAELSIRTFWARRALRILPAYYLALALATVLATNATTGRWLVPRDPTSYDLWLHILLLQNWSAASIGSINGSLWSVALELHLYLLFPVTLLLWRRLGSIVLLVMSGVLSVGWTAMDALQVGALGSSHVLPARYVQFVAGMVIAGLWVREATPPRRVLLPVALIGLVAALAVSTFEISSLASLAWTVPSAAFVLLCAGLPGRRVHATDRLGLASYSFYLCHQPILLVTAPFGRLVTSDPIALLLLGVSVGFVVTGLFAWLLHVGVEAPSHRLGRQIGTIRSGAQDGLEVDVRRRPTGTTEVGTVSARDR